VRIAFIFFLLSGLLTSQFCYGQTTPATPIAFSDFFRLPIGPRGVEPTPTLLQLKDKRVELTGFMVGQEQMPVGYFLLTPRPLRLSEHADGDADDLPVNTVAVLLPASDQQLAITLIHKPMKLTGILKLGYHAMPDGRVVWLRLLIDAPITPSILF
jgi:hypothetical protein